MKNLCGKLEKKILDNQKANNEKRKKIEALKAENQVNKINLIKNLEQNLKQKSCILENMNTDIELMKYKIQEVDDINSRMNVFNNNNNNNNEVSKNNNNTVGSVTKEKKGLFGMVKSIFKK